MTAIDRAAEIIHEDEQANLVWHECYALVNRLADACLLVTDEIQAILDAATVATERQRVTTCNEGGPLYFAVDAYLASREGR